MPVRKKLPRQTKGQVQPATTNAGTLLPAYLLREAGDHSANQVS